jgi:hypothetical protein
MVKVEDNAAQALPKLSKHYVYGRPTGPARRKVNKSTVQTTTLPLPFYPPCCLIKLLAAPAHAAKAAGAGC